MVVYYSDSREMQAKLISDAQYNCNYRHSDTFQIT